MCMKARRAYLFPQLRVGKNAVHPSLWVKLRCVATLRTALQEEERRRDLAARESRARSSDPSRTPLPSWPETRVCSPSFARLQLSLSSLPLTSRTGPSSAALQTQVQPAELSPPSDASSRSSRPTPDGISLSFLPALRLGSYVDLFGRATILQLTYSTSPTVGHFAVLLGTIYTLLGLVTFSSRSNSYYISYAGAIASWGIVVVSLAFKF